MLNNESWLGHTDLFTKHWIVEKKHWVRSLGWVDDFIDTVRDAGGWVQAGDKELTTLDYINIIDAVGSEQKLYRYDGGTWEHISGPVVFVVTKDDQKFIVGWAGDAKTINKYKKESDNAWDWPEKIIVEIDPVVALYVAKPEPKPENKVPVFFISNGESNADENWQHLVKLCPRALRIDKIKGGRRAVFHKCVDMANGAEQFFVVTGKNYVTDKTIFDYPVKDTKNAHVVFYAKNMSNRLEYGHMGVVCYNTNLVLNTPENFGLDFTQYSNIHTIPRTVSEARFATTPYEAWRTAFRETVKLTLRYGTDNEMWLDRWLAFAEGENSEWVLKGAEAGHQFAEQHRDNKDMLKNTENWDWLEKHFKCEYEL